MILARNAKDQKMESARNAKQDSIKLHIMRNLEHAWRQKTARQKSLGMKKIGARLVMTLACVAKDQLLRTA